MRVEGTFQIACEGVWFGTSLLHFRTYVLVWVGVEVLWWMFVALMGVEESGSIRNCPDN